MHVFMSRKISVILLFFCVLGAVSAQNLQLHFDPRHSLYGDDVAPANYLTATFEMLSRTGGGYVHVADSNSITKKKYRTVMLKLPGI